MKPKTLIMRTAGTNADVELAHAFEVAGADTEFVHLNRLIKNPAHLGEFDLLGVPGGFSYGDDISAGRIYATRVRHRLYGALREFVLAGKPVIGICNGFQLLVKTGLLPGFELPQDTAPAQLATLTDNTIPQYVDRWVGIRTPEQTPCIWTKGLDEFDLPIAHGEGRFVSTPDVLARLNELGQIAIRYTSNPNGSMEDVAGICDPTGLVFGLMPHPERYVTHENHPCATRDGMGGEMPAGLAMFINAVEYATVGKREQAKVVIEAVDGGELDQPMTEGITSYNR